MSAIEIVAGSMLLLCSLCIILAVMLQSGKGDGLSGAIMGGGDYSYRGKGKDNDAKLARMTKILAVVFFVVTLAVNVIALSAK
ncbi:MAG: preprotein translocase subunit SecG [Oscillospiraceae bacterium]|nr:preprotein translocase subunit SecG [Oscillospiraceae bacterium]